MLFRSGSALVKEKREQAERAKAAAKLASLGGTSLGNIMGVKDEEAEAEGACRYNLSFPLARLDIHLVFVSLLLYSRSRTKAERRERGGL